MFEELTSTTGSTFTGASTSVRWVHNSTENPPVRAIVAVTKLGGNETKTIKIYPESTADSVLEAVGAEPNTVLREVGGNICLFGVGGGGEEGDVADCRKP